MKNKICFCLLTIFLLYSKIFADISISASVDKNVISLDEQLTLQVVVSGDTTNIPQPNIPNLPDFQIYSSGRSQSISIINGQINSSVSFNYVLSPKHTGEFEIPPISVNYKGKIYQTEPIKIKVEKTTSQRQQRQIPIQHNVYQGKQRNIFVETFVDKKSAYVNEQITLTFRFYTRINLLSQPQYTPPDTTGFITEDLPPQKNYYTIIDGQRYYVSEIKTALFPATAGKFVIGTAIVKCVIEDFDTDDFFSDSFFKSFFSSGKEIILKSQPIEIDVLPLPQPQPQFFSGNVGKYEVEVSLDKQKLEQNETTFLNIKISGVGNIKSITMSKALIESFLGKNFLVYDPITSFDIKKESYLLKGNKTFKVPISPQVAGSLTIPDIKFVYFNPYTKKYETAISKSITLDVLPSTKQTQFVQQKIFQDNSQSKKLELEDIRYLKTEIKTRSIKSLNTDFYLIIQIIPILCWLSVRTYKLYREHRLKDIKKYRATIAFKIAKKEIKKVKRDEDFIERFYDIVASYLSDKIGISKEAVNIEEIKKFFKEKLTEQTYKEIISLWEELNFYRFAPTKAKDINFSEWRQKIINVLQKVEYEI